MAQAYFVTGTDTGVGKTSFALAWIRALQQRGLKVAAMKPIAAGLDWIEGRWINEDVLALSAATDIKMDLQTMNPYAFKPAIAPHIAAAQEGVTIELDKIGSAYAALAAQADVVVVEGAGGFRVPLSDKLNMSDLVQALDLPVILVVGMRLGCLNHALLTTEATTHRGLKWAGWVANILEPEMPALEENIATLQATLPGPYLGRLVSNKNGAHHDAELTMQGTAAFAQLGHASHRISTLE